MNKFIKKIKTDYGLILFISIIVNILLFCIRDSIYVIAADTPTYQIKSISELFGYRRTPGYQLINYFFYVICAKDYYKADYLVILFQTILSIISVQFVYDALKMLTNRRYLSLYWGIVYTIIVAIYGFNEKLLTESIAVSMMGIILWILIKSVKTNNIKYFVVLAIAALLATLHRPSFLILYPLLAIYYVLYFIFTNKKIGIISLISLLISTSVIIGYCEYNKLKLDTFCLNDTSYQNEMGILIEANVYYNDDYPEIVSYVTDNIINKNLTNKCMYATMIAEKYGYPYTLEYMRSCRRNNVLPLAEYYLKSSIIPNLGQYLVMEDSVGPLGSLCFNIVKYCLFPFNYCFVITLSFVFLVDVIKRIILNKRILYVELGVISCIWCILILSIGTLYCAPLMRIAIHLIPCFVVMMVMIIERIVDIIK